MFDFRSEWTEWEREMPIPFYPLVFREPWFHFIMLTISLALKLLKDYQAFYSEKIKHSLPRNKSFCYAGFEICECALSFIIVCLFFFWS